MITLPGNPRQFYLHLANYCDGPVTCVTLSEHADPLAWGWRVSDNRYPESRRLLRDHFYLIADQEIMIRVLISAGIIEPVVGGLRTGPHDDLPYRLCAGIVPDTDSRFQPLEVTYAPE